MLSGGEGRLYFATNGALFDAQGQPATTGPDIERSFFSYDVLLLVFYTVTFVLYVHQSRDPMHTQLECEKEELEQGQCIRKDQIPLIHTHIHRKSEQMGHA